MRCCLRPCASWTCFIPLTRSKRPRGFMDTASSNAPLSMTSSELAGRLGRGDAPIPLDVRKAPAYDVASRVIAGALRIAPDDVKAIAPSLPRNREVVAYCVHGHAVSQGAAQALRDAGLEAH